MPFRLLFKPGKELESQDEKKPAFWNAFLLFQRSRSAEKVLNLATAATVAVALCLGIFGGGGGGGGGRGGGGGEEEAEERQEEGPATQVRRD